MSKAKQKKQFYLLSLGCSKNTVDSTSMADLLMRAGFSAADDPVIPAADFQQLVNVPLLTVLHQSFGGHCGFIDLFPHRRWYNDTIMEIIGDLPEE